MGFASALVGTLVLSGLLAGQAAAAQKAGRTCPQALAGYGTLDQSLLLEFAGSADGRFRVLLGTDDAMLEGFVFPGESGEENEAVVLNNCPEGDATGEELEACTIWQGSITALEPDGTSVPLPSSDQSAAGLLQLVGFADALAASEFFKQTGLPVLHFDKLTLLACQE